MGALLALPESWAEAALIRTSAADAPAWPADASVLPRLAPAVPVASDFRLLSIFTMSSLLGSQITYRRSRQKL
jgi:hypothetical protein